MIFVKNMCVKLITQQLVQLSAYSWLCEAAVKGV